MAWTGEFPSPFVPFLLHHTSKTRDAMHGTNDIFRLLTVDVFSHIFAVLRNAKLKTDDGNSKLPTTDLFRMFLPSHVTPILFRDDDSVNESCLWAPHKRPLGRMQSAKQARTWTRLTRKRPPISRDSLKDGVVTGVQVFSVVVLLS